MSSYRQLLEESLTLVDEHFTQNPSKRGTNSFSRKRRKEPEYLLDKRRRELNTDYTQDNIQKLTRRKKKEVLKLQSKILEAVTPYKAEDYIALENAARKAEEQKAAQLDEDLDSFIAGYFGEGSSKKPVDYSKMSRNQRKKIPRPPPYKSEKVLAKEAEREEILSGRYSIEKLLKQKPDETFLKEDLMSDAKYQNLMKGNLFS